MRSVYIGKIKLFLESFFTTLFHSLTYSALFDTKKILSASIQKRKLREKTMWGVGNTICFSAKFFDSHAEALWHRVSGTYINIHWKNSGSPSLYPCQNLLSLKINFFYCLLVFLPFPFAVYASFEFKIECESFITIIFFFFLNFRDIFKEISFEN